MNDGKPDNKAMPVMLIPMDDIILRTKDHPLINGRPEGEFSVYSVTFPLEHGMNLIVEMGKEGMANLRNVVLSEHIDIEFEKIEGVSIIHVENEQ